MTQFGIDTQLHCPAVRERIERINGSPLPDSFAAMRAEQERRTRIRRRTTRPRPYDHGGVL